MKTIHFVLNDSDFKKISSKKNKSEMNWNDFLLKASLNYENENENKNKQ